MFSVEALNHDQQHWSVFWMLCLSLWLAAGLLPNRWAESSMWSSTYASSTPITNYTSTTSQHDLSSCVDGDARHSISYCTGCPWSWRHVYTNYILLFLLLGFIPWFPTKPQEHNSWSLPVWMHKVMAAVMGNSGCKSADSDLIKCAWPLGWGGWMGHAPLSSHTAPRLDFNAQTLCSQKQWHYHTKAMTCITDQWDVDLIASVIFLLISL